MVLEPLLRLTKKLKFVVPARFWRGPLLSLYWSVEGSLTNPLMLRLGLVRVWPLLGLVKVTVGGVVSAAGLKLAETERLVFMDTVQLPLPLQAPSQPVKAWPLAGVALRVTCVLASKLLLHEVEQLIPLRLLMVPLPLTDTLSV
jgi:hypothetical protein